MPPQSLTQDSYSYLTSLIIGENRSVLYLVRERLERNHAAKESSEKNTQELGDLII